MKGLHNHFKQNGLFFIMFIVTVITIVSVSVIMTWTTFRMSEKFFIDKFSITNAKVMDQVKENFEDFHYATVIASNNISQSGAIKSMLTKEQTNAQKMESIYNMNQQINRIKSPLEAYGVEIMITGVNGFNYSTSRTYWPITFEELRTNQLTKNTLKNPNRLIYQFGQRENQRSETVDDQFIVVSKALQDRISRNVYGTMYFVIQESEFKTFYSSFTSAGNDVFVINKSGDIVSSNQSSLVGQKAEELVTYLNSNQPKKYEIGEIQGEDHIIFTNYLPSLDLYLVNLIDKKTAISGLFNKKQIVLLLIGIVVVALVIVFLVTRRVTNSLSTLVRQIENTSKYNFDQYVSVTGTYETRQIGLAFNAMLDELQEYLVKLVQFQKEKRHAELAALQQQINPHFLYNTLTSIKFMVQQGGKAEAEETIHSLISLLQNTLGNVSETITVKQEVDNLKAYVFINQMRYGDRIKVNYFISPECEQYHIPKLILQPFVENAFFHGFTSKTDGFINLMIWKKDHTLVCEVMDNGDGMEISPENNLPKTKRKQQHFTGIGVRNVHERLQLVYGETCGVEITSELGKGTSVKIRIPLNEDEKFPNI
ncbi:cache domain-containing sensor histidine kinase [Metabacillus schmidteae]|uniref:cache domain-containing sensor histidine kinase n=1 Tax=Metabacillus schmidteae TaxID=2730405 RepID=UPI0026C84F0B|nr:sensor histidine kinase [Metabacillus schmidteae]